jgi:hypothetical protein
MEKVVQVMAGATAILDNYNENFPLALSREELKRQNFLAGRGLVKNKQNDNTDFEPIHFKARRP